MSRPTVLHVITGLDDGGAEAVLYGLVTADPGHVHIVVSLMGPGKYGPLLGDAGVTVHALGMSRGRLSLRSCHRLWTLVRSSGAIVVQTWMYHADLVGGIVARLAGKRAVIWGLHNAFLGPREARVIVHACARLSRLVPRRIISCSDRAARLHASLGYASERLRVIPNGYDLSRFRHDERARHRLRSEWGVGPEGIALGMVARWSPEKDHANLAEALGQLAAETNLEWRLILVGTSMVASNAALVGLLERFGLRQRTCLLGPQRAIAEVMSALDLHILSSAAEAFPNVVAEAMACETPCVVTDVGDAGLIVGDTGWVVPNKDASRLAQGIERALHAKSDTQGWADRRRAARERIATHFSLARMVRSYSEVWHEAASGGK